MTDLSAITNSMNNAYANASGGGAQLTQGDFLRLMATQLRSQDPSQPMDPTSFFNQISQFSLVSGMQGLQSSFSLLAQAMQANQSLTAVGLIGHKAMIASGTGALGEDGMQGAVGVPAGATSVKVSITDSAGNLVRTLDLGAPASGTFRFTWDGLGDDGATLPQGNYKISAQATVDGTGQAATTYAVATVQGLTPGTAGSEPLLDLGSLGRVRLSQLFQIV